MSSIGMKETRPYLYPPDRARSLFRRGRFFVFVPCYNEYKDFWVLRRNVDLILKQLPDAVVVISDNASSDGTWIQLLRLAAKHNRVVLMKNRVNIGFSKNLGNVLNIPADSIVLWLGVNDYVTLWGLVAVRHHLKIANLWDVTLFNWVYSAAVGTYGKRFAVGDMTAQFTVRRLEEYFDRNPYLPNGIMQWLAKRRHLQYMTDHFDMASPHLGVFFDMFPCRVRSAGKVLCAVHHTEDGGWRAAAKSIFMLHVLTLSDITKLARNRGISAPKLRKLHRRYTRDLIGLLASMHDEAGWGGRFRLGFAGVIRIAGTISMFRALAIFLSAAKGGGQGKLARNVASVIDLLTRLDAALEGVRGGSATAERDERIAVLDHVVVEGDALYAGTSRRITAPLRSVGRIRPKLRFALRHPKKVLASLRPR